MRAAKEDRPIRVSVAGMNERMKNTLRFFFQGPCKNHCVLVEDDSAELTIIDLDGYQGRKYIGEYRERHPERPLILLSLLDAGAEDAILLRKPLNPKHLISALNQAQATIQPPAASTPETTPEPQPEDTIQTKAQERAPISRPIDKLSEHLHSEPASNPPPGNKGAKTDGPPKSDTHRAAMYLDEHEMHAYIGSAPDIDRDNTPQLARAQYDPGEFFQGRLSQATITADKHKRAVELKMPYGAIVILPDTHCVMADIEESRLRTFCAVPVIDGTLTVSIKKRGPTAEDIEQTTPMGMEPLLWNSAIWASRGRLPIGTSLTQPVFLRRWPNMTRMMLFPHALRIAALWADQPHSLLDTAEVLGIPQRYVFGFYSAANALGLAAVSQRETDSLVEPAPVKKSRRHGLLGRILSHLRKDGNKEMKQ